MKPHTFDLMGQYEAMRSMTAINAILSSMGYREAKPGRWLKPVGYHLFEYNEATGRWTNWFKGADGVIHVWESHPLTADTTIADIKRIECDTRTDIRCASEFQL